MNGRLTRKEATSCGDTGILLPKESQTVFEKAMEVATPARVEVAVLAQRVYEDAIKVPG